MSILLQYRMLCKTISRYTRTWPYFIGCNGENAAETELYIVKAYLGHFQDLSLLCTKACASKSLLEMHVKVH